MVVVRPSSGKKNNSSDGRMGSEILTNHPSTNQPSNRLTDVQKGSWGSFTFNKLKYIHIYVQKMPSKAISRLYQGL